MNPIPGIARKLGQVRPVLDRACLELSPSADVAGSVQTKSSLGVLSAVFVAVVLSGCDCSGGTGGTPVACDPGGNCADGRVCVAGVCVAPGADASLCIDNDGDGFGRGCARGNDCDDGDPRQMGREICDGEDNDCDGVVDNGVLSECGDCDPSCHRGGIGAGGDGFDLTDDENDGVELDPDGALVLETEHFDSSYIWVADTTDGSVSKIDTRSFEELGRYITGPDGTGNDPSRTSVNTAGDVFVGNRAANTVSRISALGEACPDTNGDGDVTTSSGRDDVLPWLSDDCVLWNTDLDVVSGVVGERHVRAVAAQDVSGLDGTRREYVWIGAYDTSKIIKLDGRTGDVLLVTDSPIKPYGFALDAAGRLWVTTSGGDHGSNGGYGFAFIDTNTCLDAASCDVAVCSGAEGTCDGAVKAKFRTNNAPYGITVDFRQRVWVSGLCMDRYDPAAPAGTRHVEVCPALATLPAETIGECNASARRMFSMNGGVAADGHGWVWAAGRCHGVLRFEGDDPTHYAVVADSEMDGSHNRYFVKGMAIDMDGKVWVITAYHDLALVITPGATLMESSLTSTPLADIAMHYTYSDMTGLQLRLATNPRGYYRHAFEGCREWQDLTFDAETPPDTVVTFRIRTAASVAELAAATWLMAATVPPDTSPIAIAPVLAAGGVTAGTFLEVEVELAAERTSTTEVVTPKVRSFGVSSRCPEGPM